MQTPIASGEAAMALIPQRPPFVLVDTLLSATKDTFRSAFTVPAGHVLLDVDDTLLEAGLMENAAQTAAMGMGWNAALVGVPPPLGFIGAISDVEVHGRPAVGERIETTVAVRHEVMNARVLEAETTRDGRVLARMGMKVFIMEAGAGDGDR